MIFNAVLISIFVFASVGTLASADEQPVSVHDRLDAHKDGHKFLFEDFIKKKKCLWNKSKDRLFEIRLLSGEFDIEQDIELPDGTNKAMQFFDRLVLRSESGFEGVESVELLDDKGKRKKLRRFGTNETSMVLWLPRKLDRSGPLFLVVSSHEKIELSEVAIRSKSGVLRDFEKLKEWWLTFPNSKTDLQLKFIEDTAKLGLDELFDALRHNSEASVRLLVPASLPSSGGEHISMFGILADRRVSRIHELLSALEPEVAETITKENFDSQFELFSGHFTTTNSAPYPILHAMDTSLFLCSEFCSPEDFQGFVNKWQQ